LMDGIPFYKVFLPLMRLRLVLFSLSVARGQHSQKTENEKCDPIHGLLFNEVHRFEVNGRNALPPTTQL